MARRIGWLATLLVLAATLAGTASASTPYSVLDLGPSAHLAQGINDRGNVVGEADPALAFVFDRAGLTILPTLAWGATADALAINERGEVVGWLSAPIEPHAFLYRAGHLSNLGTAGGRSTAAYDVNDRDQVVGEWESLAFERRPFVYEGGHMRTLGFAGFATGIDDRGRIVGEHQLNAPSLTPFEAFEYENGSLRDLGTLPGGSNSAASDVDELGRVVGWSDCSGCVGRRAFLYAHGTMRDLGTLAGQSSEAFGLNDFGKVVGTSSTPLGPRAFLWSDGIMRDLNDLIPPIAGGSLQGAKAINLRGQIAAYGIVGSAFHAFLLTPRHA